MLHTIDEETFINAISLGVRGYLTEESNTVQFIEAIRAVVKEEIWADGKIVAKVLTRLLPLRKDKSDLNFNLTKREEEIVMLVVQGWSNKQISKQLFISDKTVKTHLVNIFKKLGINNRFQLAVNFLDESSPTPSPGTKSIENPGSRMRLKDRTGTN